MAKLLDGTRIYGSVNVDTQVTVGTNVFINTSTIFVGNTLINSTVNSTAISLGNSIANSTFSTTQAFIANSLVSSNLSIGTLYVGNSSTNTVINSSAIALGYNISAASQPGVLLMGANVTTTAMLQFGNSIANVVVNIGGLYSNISSNYSLVVNTSTVQIGNSASGTVSMRMTGFTIDNTTVNAGIKTTSIYVNPSAAANTTGSGGLYATGTSIFLGNTGSNAVINTTGVYIGGVQLTSGSVNTAAQYTWTNTQTFTNTITHSSNVIVNNTLTVGNSTVNTQTNATHFYTGNSTYYGYGNNITDVIVSPSGNIIISSTYAALSNSTASNTVVVSTSGITFGNSTVNAAITTNSTVTSFSGTANNALNFGGYGLSTFVTNSQLSTTLTNYVNTTANFTYTGTQTFSNTVIHAGILGVNSVIQINGSNGTAGQVLTSNGTVSYWALPTVPQSNAISDSFTANGTQTTFTISTAVRNQNNSIVTLDGMVQLPVTHYSISGTTLTMTTAPIANSIVEVRNFDNIYAGGSSGVSTGKAIAMAIVFGG